MSTDEHTPPCGGRSDAPIKQIHAPAVPSDPAAPPLEIHPTAMPASVQNNVHSKLSAAALFVLKKD